ncbi:MAG: hypothetical protein ACLSA6_18070 [Holdemania massiliensis]
MINKLLDQIVPIRGSGCSIHRLFARQRRGAAVVVVPNQPEDAAYAQSKADEIYDFVWRGIRSSILPAMPMSRKGWAAMLKHEGRPVSGRIWDNVTPAPGGNTVVLWQVLAETDYHGKSILLAGITDKNRVNRCLSISMSAIM